MWCLALCILICAALGAISGNDNVYISMLKYGIVPDIIKTAPLQKISVTFASGRKAKLGNHIGREDLESQPQISWEGDPDWFYTFSMIDAGISSRMGDSKPPFLQWLVINIPGDDIHRGCTITPFLPSFPVNDRPVQGFPPSHRYVFLLYAQGEEIKGYDMIDFKRHIENRTDFSITKLCNKFGMCRPQAANLVLVKFTDLYYQYLKTFITNHKDEPMESDYVEDQSTDSMEEKPII